MRGRDGEGEGERREEGGGRHYLEILSSEHLQESHLVNFFLHLCIVIAIQNDAYMLSCHTTCGARMMAL